MPNFDQSAFCNRTNGLNTSVFVFPSNYDQYYNFSKFSLFAAALRVSFHFSKCPRSEGLAIILQLSRLTASHMSQQERKYENLWNGWDWFLKLRWVLRAPCWQLRSPLVAVRRKKRKKLNCEMIQLRCSAKTAKAVCPLQRLQRAQLQLQRQRFRTGAQLHRQRRQKEGSWRKFYNLQF